MGGIISRFKKDPSPGLSIDTSSHTEAADDQSTKSSSPSKKSTKNLTNEPDMSPSQRRISPSKSSKKIKNKPGSPNTSTANKSSVKGREANKQFQRKVYLKDRAAKLRGRLKDRPFDQRALQEYGSILYEQENYITAPKVIKRILATGDTAGDWYLKLGKCYFRRWARMGNINGK
jgi:hypothetical protein